MEHPKIFFLFIRLNIIVHVTNVVSITEGVSIIQNAHALANLIKGIRKQIAGTS